MIEKAIHEILGNATLPPDLPVDRIVTGAVQAGTMPIPYATLELRENRNAYRSNQSTVNQPKVHLRIWDDQHSRASGVRSDLISVFDNLSLTTDDLNILSCRTTSDHAVQHPSGIWEFVIELQFVVMVANPAS
jgi:hypothetical protein